MMYDLTGYMVINGKDAWTEYSAFLCEDSPEDSTNVTELLKPPEMKEYRLYYKAATPADILTDAFDGSTVARWKMKFREPKPEPF